MCKKGDRDLTEDDPVLEEITNLYETGKPTIRWQTETFRLKTLLDDHTYNFGIKIVWRAVAVSFSEAHPFLFFAVYICKNTVSLVPPPVCQLRNRHP